MRCLRLELWGALVDASIDRSLDDQPSTVLLLFKDAIVGALHQVYCCHCLCFLGSQTLLILPLRPLHFDALTIRLHGIHNGLFDEKPRNYRRHCCIENSSGHNFVAQMDWKHIRLVRTYYSGIINDLICSILFAQTGGSLTSIWVWLRKARLWKRLLSANCISKFFSPRRIRPGIQMCPLWKCQPLMN